MMARKPLRLGRRIAQLALFAAGCVLGVAIFQFAFMPLAVGHGKEIEVPDVVGLQIEDATRVLEGVGLKGLEAASRIDPKWPPGTVLEQNPPPGLRARQERPIALVTGLGRGIVPIPGIVGESLRHAELILARDGIPVGRIARLPAEAPEGQVLKVSPASGTRLVRGRAVDLLISSGEAEAAYLMPDFTGADPTRVGKDLKRLGFVVEIEYPIGVLTIFARVLSQSPPPGHRILAGETIKLVVGEGV